MRNPLGNFLRSLPPGPRLILLIYVLGYPVGRVGHFSGTFELQNWLGLSPALVWKGQVWRLVTYGFLPSGLMDWAVSLFWLISLASAIGRNWTSRGFTGYCALTIFGGALPIMLLNPAWDTRWTGSAALVFGLFVAWAWFCGNERMVMLGLGEVSVRTIVILMVIVSSVTLFSTAGLATTLVAWCGGFAGWLWLFASTKFSLAKPARQVHSERGARLEL